MTQRDSNLGRFDFGAGETAAPRPGRRVRGRVAVAFLGLALVGGGAAYLWFFDRDTANLWLQKTPMAPPSKETTAYKWRDPDGSWQITDRPPPEGVPYETITVRSDVNILPAVDKD